VGSALQSLERRAGAILRARPAYKEPVEFYLTVFRRQIERAAEVCVRPEPVEPEQARQSLREGVPLIERYDPGLDVESLRSLWTEMKGLFRRGNDVLRSVVQRLDEAEHGGRFDAGLWLLEQRPWRPESVAQVAAGLGIGHEALAALAWATTYPHWQRIARSWLPGDRLGEWQRGRCPACAGPVKLAELHGDPPGEGGVTGGARMYLHCAFCGARWTVPPMQCPHCSSRRAGDAKYYFTTAEPELRIDFCGSCRRYLKTVDGDRIEGPVHAYLEWLASAHLDTLAEEKDLVPLECKA